MDKISFIFPNNKQNNKFLTESIQNIKTENSNNNLTTNSITNYIKIAPNVYRFYNKVKNNDFNLEDNIYILYINACQVKMENIYTAIEMFKKCYKLINDNTKKEVKYEIYVNLALLLSDTDISRNEIYKYYDEALEICPDRAEPYYYCSIYCNKIKDFEKSYDLLKKALELSFEDANKKYPGTQFTAYGKHLYYELAVACYWLKKFEEAKVLLNVIVDDPDFNEHNVRIKKNLELTVKELENI